MQINEIQNEIKNGTSLPLCNDDTLKYLQKPVGKALYRGRPKKDIDSKAKPNDRVKCDTCGKDFIRSNRSSHKNTKYHQLYEKVNKKMANLILN